MHIRVCKSTVMTRFPEAKVAVSTAKSALIVIQLLLDAHNRLRVANGIAEASHNKPFWLFARNFASNERFLPKHLVITTATKSPLSLNQVSEDVSHDLVRCLKIFGDAQKMSGTTEKGE